MLTHQAKQGKVKQRQKYYVFHFLPSKQVMFRWKPLYNGGLAQLARALALQARGHRFDSDILHQIFGINI